MGIIIPDLLGSKESYEDFSLMRKGVKRGLWNYKKHTDVKCN